MRIMGISGMFHDAAITVIEDGEIVFAGHAERYSKIKNDAFINHMLVQDALAYGKPDLIALHEKSWLKKARQLFSGDWNGFREPSMKKWLTKFYPELANIPMESYYHHETHAASGAVVSEHHSAAVMVLDAIGEFTTSSIWQWQDNKLKKLHSMRYPDSLGLFYTAMTAYVGLKPNEDEYILMGMAAYGEEKYAKPVEQYIDRHWFAIEDPFSDPVIALTMVVDLHRGIHPDYFAGVREFDLALAAQNVIERRILAYAQYAQQLTGSDTLIYQGGVALNCVANSKLTEIFKTVSIMPNPGDAGSSLGTAAQAYLNHTGQRPVWRTPYLGTEIPGAYPVTRALESLRRNEIFGIANGRAEFGPRALGNRSLMADPRGAHIKDRMNQIKRRQEFRPFAPVILEEYAHEYFDMPTATSPYMQFVARCKRPDEFPAIIHADGTSRVQTVNAQQHPGLHDLLTKFHQLTGCPMLLNTSLNIKGQPIVNDELDAAKFQEHYGITVHTRD